VGRVARRAHAVTRRADGCRRVDRLDPRCRRRRGTPDRLLALSAARHLGGADRRLRLSLRRRHGDIPARRDPPRRSRNRRHLARRPAPTTHAAAAALGGFAYVVGGRGIALGMPTARIVSIELATRRVRAAGALSAPRSDLAAATVGGRILVAGGRGPSGTLA